MTRLDFERREAASRGKTPAQMGADGFYSAICACGGDSCSGWQTVAVAPGLNRREAQELLKDFSGLAPRLFGGT